MSDEPDEGAEQSADERLVQATRGLSEQIARFKEELQVTQRLTQRTRIGMWVAIAAAAFSGLLSIGGVILWNEIQNSQETTCENANKTREGQRAAWAELFDVSAASILAEAEANGTEPSQAVLDYYADYTTWVEEDVFPDRNCEDLGEEIKEIAPPPSFEDAVREHVEQQDR